MKIRTDFVTNSSSSSFIAVFGTEIDKELAEQSKEFYKCNIFTGKYLKENWDELKDEFTDSWNYVDPFPSENEIDDEKLYFAYSSREELTEDEDYNQSDGYDYDEINNHEMTVDAYLTELKGFKLEFASWEGRDG